MTMDQYLSNPMGKGSAVPMSGELKRTLDSKYNEIRSKIVCSWYLYREKTLIALLKIPSRTVDIQYDVIVEFDLNSLPEGKNVTNLCNFRVYSNCPSFVFTYAHTFYQNNLLCTWATSKYSKEVLKKRPDVRNRYQVINFEKSLYFAFKYLSSEGRNNVKLLIGYANKEKNYSNILRWVLHNEEILERYNYQKDRERRKIEKNTKREKVPIKKLEKPHDRKSIAKVKKSNKVSKVSKIKKI